MYERILERENITDADCRYGAPMGRRDWIDIAPDDRKTIPLRFFMRHLTMVDCGAYDAGGVYWGSGNPIFHAWSDGGAGEENEQEIFVRARNRSEAKATIRESFPKARFYR